MRTVTIGLALASMLFAARVMTAAATQAQSSMGQAADQKTITRISLGTASGTPGSAAVVPINFSPAVDLKIRRLKLTVKFRSAKLKFEKLDRGPAAEMQNTEIHLEDYVTSGEDERRSSTLIVVASVLSNDASQNALPAGELGALTFRIDADEDSDGAIIDLDLSAEATEVGSNQPLPSDKIRTSDATVYILGPMGGIMGIPGCFFFTH